jgi:hypothetical protein
MVCLKNTFQLIADNMCHVKPFHKYRLEHRDEMDTPEWPSDLGALLRVIYMQHVVYDMTQTFAINYDSIYSRQVKSMSTHHVNKALIVKTFCSFFHFISFRL